LSVIGYLLFVFAPGLLNMKCKKVRSFLICCRYSHICDNKPWARGSCICL